MNIFKNRPLALGCALFLLLLYVLYHGSIVVSASVLVAGIVLVFCLLVFNLRKNCTPRVRAVTVYLIPVVLAIILSSILSVFVYQSNKAKAEALYGTEGQYTVVIESEEYESSYKSSYVGEIKELDIRAVVTVYGCEFNIGDTVKADIILEKLTDGKYGTGAEKRHLENGILIGAECYTAVRLEKGAISIRTAFSTLNESFSKRISSMTDKDTSAVVSALLLGNKSGLSQSDRRDFARLGISHILALSGMHLSIIAVMISGVLTGTGFNKRWKYILTLAVVLGFICLTGFSTSVLRAGLMLTILYISFFFKQKADIVTRVFAAVSIICILSPYSVFSVSLMLSFFAVLGCIIGSFIMTNINKGRKHKRQRNGEGFNALNYFVGSIITTVVISLITLPVIFFNFSFVSVISPLSNIIFIPLFTLLLYLSPVLLILGKAPFIGKFIVWICEKLTFLILYSVRNMSLIRGIAIPFDSKLHPYAVILIFLSVLVFMSVNKRRAYIPIISLVVGCSLFIFGSSYTSVYLSRNSFVFTSSGDGGDVTYVRSDRKISVIDSQMTTRSATGEIHNRAVDMGYCEIENYILTDYCQYSPSALDYLSGNIVIRNLYLPEPADKNEMELYNEICSSAKKNGVLVSLVSSEMSLGDLDFYVCSAEFLSRSEKRLVAFSIEGETSRYTYIGASVYESFCTRDFAEAYIESSDAVYFGAYGPKYAIPFEFNISGIGYFTVSSDAKDYFYCNAYGAQEVLPETVFILK